MRKTKTVKKIKESITLDEFKRLMRYTQGDDTIRANTKQNFLRAFVILFYTGLRLNEVQELRVKQIKELVENGQTKIILSKTHNERKLFATDEFKRELKKLFDFTKEDLENRVIAKGSDKNNRTGINHIVFISAINKQIKKALGDGFTSHSFRQGLITEMASKGVNTKVIAGFINHKNVSTTLRYVKPTDEIIANAMIR